MKDSIYLQVAKIINSFNSWLEGLWKSGGWKRFFLILFFLLLPTTVAVIVSGQSMASVIGGRQKKKNLASFLKMFGVWAIAWIWLVLFYGFIVVWLRRELFHHPL